MEPSPTPFIPVSRDDAPASQELSIVVSGPEEMVFDWTEDRCEDEHIPDIAARAFRDADGNVQLWIGHYINYRMIGPNLDEVESDCNPVMNSDYDSDPAMFNDSEWLAAPYTEDGITIYAIVHNEYRGDTHTAARPGQCPSGERLTCLDTSVTMMISKDGGDTFGDILEPPNHMVATMPYVFNDQGVPSGLRQPSNIIKDENGYYYVFTNISDYPEIPGEFPPQWVCVMRTDNLNDPDSWRYWDGESFSGRFVDPYREQVDENTSKCGELELADLAGGLNEGVIYNTELERYMMVGIVFHPSEGDPKWGVYYSLSDDLVHWTERRLLKEIVTTPNVVDGSKDEYFAYPALLDPDSDSNNFSTTDDQAYLYITRFNEGWNSLDRDLIRYPLKITAPIFTAPMPWVFENDGDTEGWYSENHLYRFTSRDGKLTTKTSGDDPYMISPPVEVPADEYHRLGIRMRVSAGDPTNGQLFFITDTDTDWGEEKSLTFDVPGDGEIHDYILDPSTIKEWNGLITQMRLDPVASKGRDIEIEIIAFVE
jgi:hypothetical protein